MRSAACAPSYRRRGIGRELLTWHRARGRQQLAASDLALAGWLMLDAEERNTSGMRLAEKARMPLVRWFTKMTRGLGDPIPICRSPRDSSCAPDAGGRRPHPGGEERGVPRPPGQPAEHRVGLDVDDGAADGALGPRGHRARRRRRRRVRARRRAPDDFASQGYTGGYIPLVGVTREWRRRGVAPALLAAALRAHRDAGYEKVALDVDSENPSGALGLHTGMGFAPGTRSVAFVEEF